MGQRFYSSVAGASALTASVSDTATSVNLTTSAGLPSQFPFTLVLDPGTASEEIVTVTALSGTSATIVRGEDGSSAQSHQAGAVVRHMATGRDFREPQQHIDAVAIVHGVTGRVVGTTDPQTIQNKTLDGSNVVAQAAVTGLASALSNTVTLTGAQTLTGKSLSGAQNTFTAIPLSAVTGSGSLVNLTSTQTLTGKSLAGDANTFTAIPLSAVPGLGFTKTSHGTATTANTAYSSTASYAVPWQVINVAHGLGVTPAVVQVTPVGHFTQTDFLASVTTKDATNFQVQVWIRNSNSSFVGSCDVDWLALA